nr:hypothetical protein Iba_chr08cCG4560 [Ipomoea batatas]
MRDYFLDLYWGVWFWFWEVKTIPVHANNPQNFLFLFIWNKVIRYARDVVVESNVWSVGQPSYHSSCDEEVSSSRPFLVSPGLEFYLNILAEILNCHSDVGDDNQDHGSFMSSVESLHSHLYGTDVYESVALSEYRLMAGSCDKGQFYLLIIEASDLLFRSMDIDLLLRCSDLDPSVFRASYCKIGLRRVIPDAGVGIASLGLFGSLLLDPHGGSVLLEGSDPPLCAGLPRYGSFSTSSTPLGSGAFPVSDIPLICSIRSEISGSLRLERALLISTSSSRMSRTMSSVLPNRNN